MLKIYDFLKKEGFVGVDGLPASSRDEIEAIVDLWFDLEGVIPKDQNIFHELFSKYSDKWFDHLRTARPSFSSLLRGWWLENARIRFNEPEKYEKRHIRKDWYGKETDPHFYSGKVFTLPLQEALGLRPAPEEEYYDRFHKILKDMVWADIFNYDILQLWPRPEWGVRDVDVARSKACAGVIIGTEKMIGEKKLKEFTRVYGVSVRTSVFMKPSTLSDWAVISEFIRQIEPTTPILLVTLADYDFDGITGVHFAFQDHFKKYYPKVHHVMCGVFPHQLHPARLRPGEAVYELGKKSAEDWLRAVRDGRIPSDMAPIEIEGKYYGIEMDAVGIDAFLPTIVEKLAELGCTQEKWTDWARAETFPDYDEVEERQVGVHTRELEKYEKIVSMLRQIKEERSRKVKKYDDLRGQLWKYEKDLEELVGEELAGIGADIALEPDFDDRKKPKPSTLIERVAVQPLEPYEDFWDPKTQTGFSMSYLVDKLEEGITEKFGELEEDIEDRVEKEIEPKVDEKVDEVLAVLEEVRTRSRIQ